MTRTHYCTPMRPEPAPLEKTSARLARKPTNLNGGRLFHRAVALTAVGRALRDSMNSSNVLGNGKTGTKLPEIGQWLAEIGQSPFTSSGRQRAPALTRTQNR